jgi:hypothetical protein
MLRSKVSVASCTLFTSLVIVLGLVGWLQGVSPSRVAQATGLIDDSLVDFAGGSGNCFVAQSPAAAPTSYGVILSPTAGTNFTDTVLQTGWQSATNTAPVTVADGVATIDDATLYAGLSTDVNNPTLYAPARTVEFSATFVAGGGSQFAGFGLDHFAASPRNPFAIFSLTDGTIRARTDNDSGSSFTDPTSASIGVPHHFRIEWAASSVIFSVDGVPVVTHSIAITDSMRPQFYDGEPGGGSLIVDWARMSDYAPSPCTYTSRVINSGVDGTSFNGISTTVLTPAGTDIAFEVITSTDNSTWSAWIPVNADGTFISSTARYLQYRATLSTTNPLVTPELQRVQVHGFGPPPTAVQVASLSAASPRLGSREVLIGIIGGVIALGGVSVVFRRRKIAS